MTALLEPIAEDKSQWAHLLPAGRIETRDTRGPFFAQDPQAIVARSFAEAGGRDIPIDYDHAIDRANNTGHPAPAAGWISKMEVRPDGIWGLVKWTSKAANAIREREYRYISPVLTHVPTDKNVVSLLRASLVNDPNLTMTALNSSERGEEVSAAEKGETVSDDDMKAELRKALGLSDDADGAAILGAVREAGKSTNSSDPARFVPIELFQKTVDELHRVNAGVTKKEAERAVAHAIEDRKLMPFMRDWAIELCTANKPAFDSFVDRMAPAIGSVFGPAFTLEQRLQLEANSTAGRALTICDDIAGKLGLSADQVKTYRSKAE